MFSRFVRKPICPQCNTTLKRCRFEWTQLWTLPPHTFRCPSCSTMLTWYYKQRALPVLASLVFLAPPTVFFTSLATFAVLDDWGWLEENPMKFSFSYLVIGCFVLSAVVGCLLVAVASFTQPEAVKFSDEDE